MVDVKLFQDEIFAQPLYTGRNANYLLAASIGAVQQSKALQTPDSGRVDIDYAD